MSFFKDLFFGKSEEKLTKRQRRALLRLAASNSKPVESVADMRARTEAGFKKIIDDAIAKAATIKKGTDEIVKTQQSIRSNYPTANTKRRGRANLTLVR